MVAEIDIFSGRPNPRWQLSETESAGLERLVERLEPGAGGRPSSPPGLGYRGFRIRGPAGATWWWAYGGFVQSPRGTLADPKRSVERFLLDHLPAEFQELRSLLESELGPG